MDETLITKIRQAAERSLKNPGKTEVSLPKQIPQPGQNFVIVFRHGETEDDRNRIFSGWRDSPLTEAEREQALDLAGKLKDLPLDVVITSDLSRSKETAQIALASHPNIRWEEGPRKA